MNRSGSIPVSGYFCCGYFCGYFSKPNLVKYNYFKYLLAQFDTGQAPEALLIAKHTISKVLAAEALLRLFDSMAEHGFSWLYSKCPGCVIADDICEKLWKL